VTLGAEIWLDKKDLGRLYFVDEIIRESMLTRALVLGL
jgi:hypothetical protein